MATDDITSVRGIKMNEAEIDRALTEFGHGNLALTRDGDAYSIPISFGYDGDRIFMTLIRFGDESKKLDFAAGTKRACLSAYNVESRFDWRSVVITGTLHEVADDRTEYAEEIMDDNAWFPSIYPPSSPITGHQRTELRIEEATGRKGEEYQ